MASVVHVDHPGVRVKRKVCEPHGVCHSTCPQDEFQERPAECHAQCHNSQGPCTDKFFICIDERAVPWFGAFIKSINVRSNNCVELLRTILELDLLHRHSIPELTPFLVEGSTVHFQDGDHGGNASSDPGCHCRQCRHCAGRGVIGHSFEVVNGGLR